MKILQIGTGRWGTNHLRVWTNLHVDLYVAEISDASRKKCIEAGIPEDHITDDYRKFLDIVQAVDIVTPAPSHYQLALEAFQKGKDILIEKPIADTAQRAQELANIVSRGNTIFQPGHVFRYDPAADFIIDYISQGNLGRIQALTGLFYGFKRPRTDGGVTISDAIHFIDFFNYIMKSVPVKVLAKCNDILKRGMDDMSWIWMDYGDVYAVVEANYFSPEKKRIITINGEKSTLVCNFASSQDKIKIYRNRHINDNNTWSTFSGEVIQQEIPPAEPLMLELKDFIKCVTTRSKPKADAQDGANAVKIVEAAIESHKQGREIYL
ncbi:MAG: Gfo/Idh/MocA family oxidoreductase [Nitrospirae bacterium]|jgi:predicted dehydrogenase|nr:Gfo/Idh/MocA family oxidoreductase [Nitrospirota bacterium]